MVFLGLYNNVGLSCNDPEVRLELEMACFEGKSIGLDVLLPFAWVLSCWNVKVVGPTESQQ